MAKTTAGVVAMAAILLAACVPARIDAAPGPGRVVVLHVTDSAHVPPHDLAEAERQVARVYHAAGVRTVWTDGSALIVQPDRAFHLDVVLLPKDMVARKSQSEGIAEQAFGTAWRPTKRAYIFYNRVVAHAILTRSNVARLLGIVIAHEVGHLLLPAFSHSPSGIMRATWEGRLRVVPGFTDDQGTTMRSLLAASSGN